MQLGNRQLKEKSGPIDHAPPPACDPDRVKMGKNIPPFDVLINFFLPARLALR
jgi:hypothetical protein